MLKINESPFHTISNVMMNQIYSIVVPCIAGIHEHIQNGR